MPSFGKHTNLVVGALLAIAGMVGIYFLVPLGWFILISAIGLYEAWTLVNNLPKDTISETIWRLNSRPLVPWLFGGFAVFLITAGIIRPTVEGLFVALFYGMLNGHFFFSRQCDEAEEDTL